ncbi:MAG: protein-L-isoaspartate(D-aspartate) O-methyltransferase [Alphaproteobacteria bacterium]
MPLNLKIEALTAPQGDALPAEAVERKGLGHPDTIADAVAEAASVALSRRYRAECGRILHHNVDKVLLAGGAAEPAFGGGRVTQPMELFLAGRAAAGFDGTTIPVGEIVVDAATAWLRGHLPTLDVDRHVRVHSLVRPGSADLVELFDRQRRAGPVLANDSSIGVGFAPLSRLENAVGAIERKLTAAATRKAHPAIGADVKVLGLREGERAQFTIAAAMVGSALADAGAYRAATETVAALARETAIDCGFADPAIAVNAADDPAAGSLYLTVTGLSAEAGDDGQAGRGNRANGLITPYRPMTMESVAGKNPVSHVGKLYNIAAGLIAARLAEALPDLGAVHCYLASRIGRPIGEPLTATVLATPKRARGLARHAGEIERIVADELARIGGIADALIDGSIALDRWPLRAPPLEVWTTLSGAHRALLDEIAAEAEATAAYTGRRQFSARTMAAMARVPREKFVRAGEAEAAYLNMPLPIGYGQTISQPYIVALMTDLLDLAGGERVLEVGTGSGYQAAILSGLAREVFSIEVVPELAFEAGAKLARLGYRNVTVKSGDGAKGWPEKAPFDAIIVTAAAGEGVPPDLVAQLRPGGRMVVPVGRGRFAQNLVLVTKDEAGRVDEKTILPVAFVPLV